MADDLPHRSSDEDELRALSVAYADAADSRDGVAMASLFVDDGALVVPDYPADLRPVVTRRGHDALQRIPEALRRYRRTFHLVGSTSFVVDGDRATGEVQCVAHHVAPAQGSAGGAGGPEAVGPGWPGPEPTPYGSSGTATGTDVPVRTGGSCAASSTSSG